jgi:hypothetical protein
MTWIRTLAVAGVACVAAAARGEDPSPERAYWAALVKAAKARDAAVDAARADYLAALKEQMLAETKKGNLDAAVAVRSKINRLEAQARETKSILKRLAGTTWTVPGGPTFQWAEDGTLYHAGRERPCAPIDAHRVVVVLASGQSACWSSTRSSPGSTSFRRGSPTSRSPPRRGQSSDGRLVARAGPDET